MHPYNRYAPRPVQANLKNPGAFHAWLNLVHDRALEAADTAANTAVLAHEHELSDLVAELLDEAHEHLNIVHQIQKMRR